MHKQPPIKLLLELLKQSEFIVESLKNLNSSEIDDLDEICNKIRFETFCPKCAKGDKFDGGCWACTEDKNLDK